MRFTILLLSILFSAIHFSCNEQVEKAPPDPLTEKFRIYLKVNFDDSIRNAPHLFVLISNKDSKQNIEKILKRLNSKFNLHKPETRTAIISVHMPIQDSLLPECKTHTDWDAGVDKLNFMITGVTLVKTDAHKVIDLLHLSAEESGMENKFLEK